MEEKLELAVFDTVAKKDTLVEIVKSLHNRNEFRIDSLWTIVIEDDSGILDIYYISQTNGEIEGYNPGRVRVIENQIWCGNYADVIASKLKQRKIPYKRGNIKTDTSVAFDRKAVPFHLDGSVEETYTPR